MADSRPLPIPIFEPSPPTKQLFGSVNQLPRESLRDEEHVNAGAVETHCSRIVAERLRGRYPQFCGPAVQHSRDGEHSPLACRFGGPPKPSRCSSGSTPSVSPISKSARRSIRKCVRCVTCPGTAASGRERSPCAPRTSQGPSRVHRRRARSDAPYLPVKNGAHPAGLARAAQACVGFHRLLECRCRTADVRTQPGWPMNSGAQ
jgi:hypothetical protein